MSVVEGWDGRIWVGTYDGLASFDGENWELWTPERLGIDNEYTGDIVSSMIADQNNVWVCFQHWEANIGSDNAPTMLVRIGHDSIGWDDSSYDIDLIGSSQGLLLASIRPGEEYDINPNDVLFVFDGKKARLEGLALDFDESRYALSKNGDLFITPVWYGEVAESLYIHRDISSGISSAHIDELEFFGKEVSWLSNDALGNVFAVIDHKAWIWAGDDWEEVQLPYESISRLQMDDYSDCIILAGTTDGKILAGFRNQLWVAESNDCHAYNLHSTGFAGLTDPQDMVIDSAGTVWFATASELIRYDGADWKMIPYEFPIIDYYGVTAGLAVNSRREVWLRYKDDLYVVEGDKLTWKKKITVLLETSFDQRDHLWALSGDKVQRLKDGTWKQFTNKESGLPATGLKDLDIDANGKVWVLSEHKIHSFNGSTWNSINLPGQIGESNFFGVDSNGAPWIMCFREVYMKGYSYNQELYYAYKDKKWHEMEVGQCLYLITADTKGGWWSWTTGPAAGVAFHHNGVHGAEVPGSPRSYGHCIYIDSNNNKWFLLPDEIMVYNEDGIKYPSSWSKTGSIGE